MLKQPRPSKLSAAKLTHTADPEDPMRCREEAASSHESAAELWSVAVRQGQWSVQSAPRSWWPLPLTLRRLHSLHTVSAHNNQRLHLSTISPITVPTST